MHAVVSKTWMMAALRENTETGLTGKLVLSAPNEMIHESPRSAERLAAMMIWSWLFDLEGGGWPIMVQTAPDRMTLLRPFRLCT